MFVHNFFLLGEGNVALAPVVLELDDVEERKHYGNTRSSWLVLTSLTVQVTIGITNAEMPN